MLLSESGNGEEQIKQHLFADFDRQNAALYINIPYCETACSYCHYTDNVFFGHNCVPNDYFSLLLHDLEDACRVMCDCHLKSVYFGGGTPSLLSDAQLSEIRFLLERNRIRADEISIELYPGRVNFGLTGNDFFTRYSLAAQAFDVTTLVKYRRNGYNLRTVRDLIDTLRGNALCNTINIDLIFDEHLPIHETVSIIEGLGLDTATIYPNTKGRGIERLVNVCCTLRTLRDSFQNYAPMLRSGFIFVKEGSMGSRYSTIENETFGDIIGIGHNSVSLIGNKSFLTRYVDGGIRVMERKNRGERYLNAFISSLPTGVSLGSVRRFFPELLSDHFLSTVSSGSDINEKHASVADSDLVYLPETEYVRFYRLCMDRYPDTVRSAYLAAIGHGDSDEETVIRTYNTRLLMSDCERNGLYVCIPCSGRSECKLPAPRLRILVEGIDGSGKDTFVQFLAVELRRRFRYGKGSTISVMGQPVSSLPYGTKAKRFIEDLDYKSKESVIRAMLGNRAASEDMIRAMPGICILIRGLVTDLATFHHAFPDDDVEPGDGNIVWNYYIVIDAKVDVADERIGKREAQRTWRESPEYLSYFRDFYIRFESPAFIEKIILENTSFAALKYAAERLANKIYAEEYSKHSA